MKLAHFIFKFPPILFLLLTAVVSGQQSYTPDDALRNRIRKEVWQNLKPQTPKKQRFLTGLTFGSNECFNLYEKAAKKRNWAPYELPTIAAFYKIILEETISGTDKSEEEIKNIYHTVRGEYESMRSFDNVPQSQLQEIYDQLVLKAIWIGTVFELSKNNSLEIQQKAKGLLNDFNIKNLIPQGQANKADKIASKEPEVSSKTITKPKVKVPIPNKTLHNSLAVEDIIMRTVTSYGLGGVYVKNEVSVLFSNGDILINPTVPLHQLNIQQSKKQQPKKWGTWKKKGSVLWVTKPWKNKTYDWKKWFKLRSGSENKLLSGRFKSSDSFGGSQVINANNVAFDEKGRFAWKSIKGGNTVWKPVYSKSTTAGTYVIQDYTLTLRYNNGITESFFFGLYPKDNEHFVIGSNHFTLLQD